MFIVAPIDFYGFSSGHVWIWELDYKERWAPKNWCFWTVVLEKTLESPLDCKEIKPVNTKGNQSWLFTGRTDVEAETPILWPPHAKSWLIWKDPDAGKDWRQEEKGMTEDEMVGWYHQLNGHGFGWTLGVGDGQGGMPCCGSWGHRESDWATELNWTELIYSCMCGSPCLVPMDHTHHDTWWAQGWGATCWIMTVGAGSLEKLLVWTQRWCHLFGRHSYVHMRGQVFTEGLLRLNISVQGQFFNISSKQGKKRMNFHAFLQDMLGNSCYSIRSFTNAKLQICFSVNSEGSTVRGVQSSSALITRALKVPVQLGPKEALLWGAHSVRGGSWPSVARMRYRWGKVSAVLQTESARTLSFCI